MAADSIMGRAIRSCRKSFEVIPAGERESRVRGGYEFAAGFAGFAGHFPEHPVVPGVSLLEAARQLAAETGSGDLELASIRQVKFFHSLGPGESVTMELRCKPGKKPGDIGVTGEARMTDEASAVVAKFQFEGRWV